MTPTREEYVYLIIMMKIKLISFNFMLKKLVLVLFVHHLSSFLPNAQEQPLVIEIFFVSLAHNNTT